MMEIKIVKCKNCPEGFTKLFVDGNLIIEGDSYHNKISQYIEGFLYAVQFLKIEHTIIKETDNICEFFCDLKNVAIYHLIIFKH